MRTLILFCCLVFVIIFKANSQSTDSVAIKRYYEANTILWQGTGKYFKGMQSYPLQNLTNEPRYSPDATFEFQHYVRNRNASNVLMVAAGTLLVSSFIVRDNNTRFGLLLGSLVPYNIGFSFSVRSKKHLSRYIWLQNRDILLR